MCLTQPNATCYPRGMSKKERNVSTQANEELFLEDFPGYSIDTSGVVRTYRRKKPAVLKPMRHPSGYLVARFAYHGKVTHIKVHRLMAKLFLDRPNQGYLEVNHIDGDKGNNRLTNLEWCTPSENQIHAYKLGLRKPIEAHQVWNSKIGPHKAQNILHLARSGIGPVRLAEMYGVNYSSIRRIIKGEWYNNV